ncbi:ABC transporter permease [Halobacillus sp. Nhm2S1]|uniref:ABC transporter permease n=1 Tax=Halobacillus sp. Nhm2S1 TaxID=2866716 RepID=UPI001C731BE5|nr:ABC transporter permease subunit [Halobacillus sp. Nhm2S1]MBX0359498.1 ABC transporter permease subunit [Halobacillus sp. Nhm2S1]
MKHIWKEPTFLLGFVFIAVMLIGSFAHALFFDSMIPKTPFTYDENGQLEGAPPFAPFDHSILGTDMAGNHLFFYILMGAKYTILGTLAVALLSFGLAFVIGIPLGFVQKIKFFQGFEQVISVMYFIPASLIAYKFLKPLMIEPYDGFPTTLAFRITVEVIVLALLLVPPAAILMANETSEVLKKEYVTSSRVLGGRGWHLFRNHLIPQLKESWLRLLLMQAIQATLILTHLGVFEMFFGGTHVVYGIVVEPPSPITFDWASIIGMYYDTIMTNMPWLIGVPLLFLVLFVLSLIGITNGIQKSLRASKPEKDHSFEDMELKQADPSDEKWFELLKRNA